jgi:exonuclease III
MCIFVNNKLTCSEVNIQKYCTDYDIEACALKIYLNKTALYILTVYRSPAGDFKKFIENLDNILIFLTNTKTEVIVCGDINVNYLINNNKKYQLNSILNSFNLFDIVDFPTQNASSIIDNIFVDYNRLEDYSIAPVYNDLSDYDGQFLTI